MNKLWYRVIHINDGNPTLMSYNVVSPNAVHTETKHEIYNSSVPNHYLTTLWWFNSFRMELTVYVLQYACVRPAVHQNVSCTLVIVFPCSHSKLQICPHIYQYTINAGFRATQLVIRMHWVVLVRERPPQLLLSLIQIFIGILRSKQNDQHIKDDTQNALSV